ncbi:MAG TPA: hypothetical protein VFX63_18895, partial [Pyrinomonadaceae bacterium]|nr:hypothetical protein [Pyrinomonadaceae bacterium]
VFVFTGSVSVLTVAVGVSSFVFGMGAAAFFGADSGSAAFDSTAAFSTVVTGVCAAIIDALIKIRVIAANQMTNSLGANLKPSISLLLCWVAQWRHRTEGSFGELGVPSWKL